MTGRLLVAVVVGSVAAVTADPSAAGTVRLVDVRGQTAVSFAAAAGERNEVSMSRGGPNWLIQDLVGNSIIAESPCAPRDVGIGTAAGCPADRVDLATAELGDGNDYFSLAMAGTYHGEVSGGSGSDGFFGSQGNDELDGGPGDDRIDGWQGMDKLVGGPGLDTLIGGEGGDVIDARDGERDEVDCGPGADRVLADSVDAVAPDCEEGGHAAEAPSAVTVIAADVGRTSARLVAVVNPRGSPTTVTFEFGPSVSYGSNTESRVIGAGRDDVVITIVVTGLRPGTEHHFRVVATNPAGTSTGRDSSFATLKAQRVCVVPRLQGLSLRAAKTALARNGCRLGLVRRTGSRAARGTIVGQRPRPGTRLRAGARVNVAVSRG